MPGKPIPARFSVSGSAGIDVSSPRARHDRKTWPNPVPKALAPAGFYFYVLTPNVPLGSPPPVLLVASTFVSATTAGKASAAVAVQHAIRHRLCSSQDGPMRGPETGAKKKNLCHPPPRQRRTRCRRSDRKGGGGSRGKGRRRRRGTFFAMTESHFMPALAIGHGPMCAFHVVHGNGNGTGGPRCYYKETWA